MATGEVEAMKASGKDSSIVDELATRLDRLHRQQAELEDNIASLRKQHEEVSYLVEAVSRLLAWESQDTGRKIPDHVAIQPSSNGRWSDTPLREAIIELLTQNPEWRKLEHMKQYRAVLHELRKGHYPFRTKRDDLAVNMALIKARKLLTSQGAENNIDDGTPGEV